MLLHPGQASIDHANDVWNSNGGPEQVLSGLWTASLDWWPDVDPTTATEMI